MSHFKFLWVMFLIVLLASCTNLQRRTEGGTGGVLPRQIKDESIVSLDSENLPKKRLLILPFLDESDRRPKSLRDLAQRAFTQDINRTGKVLAFDVGQVKLDASSFLKDNAYKMQDLSKAAATLGVNAVVEAKIIDIRIRRKGDNIGVVRNLRSEFDIVAQVRVVNVRRGKEVFNTIKTVTVEDQNVRVAERVEADRFIENNPQMIEVLVKDAFLDFVPQVMSSIDQVEWQGRVAAISGDRIYLNVGKASGLMVGDLLKVMEDGDDVYDPESGSHIGRVQGRLKGTLEVISYFGTDGAIATVHSGGGFKENDRVEMY